MTNLDKLLGEVREINELDVYNDAKYAKRLVLIVERMREALRECAMDREVARSCLRECEKIAGETK